MYNVVSLFCGCGGVDLGTVGGFRFNKGITQSTLANWFMLVILIKKLLIRTS